VLYDFAYLMEPYTVNGIIIIIIIINYAVSVLLVCSWT